MGTNVITDHQTVPIAPKDGKPGGFKTYYTTRVVETTTSGGETTKTELAAESTTDYNEAKENYQQALKENPGATVNGASSETSEPFEDGTVPGPIGGMAPLSSPPTTKLQEPGLLSPLDESNSDLSMLKSFNDESDLSLGGSSFSLSLFKKAEDTGGLGPLEEDIKGLNPDERAKLGNDGSFGSAQPEARINRPQAGSEKVIRGPTGNAFIVLGKDRDGHEASGYGGKANTQCDAIYICAGMGGASPKQSDKDGDLIYTNPNFFVDAAMIYISQKTDADTNFSIGKRENFQNTEGKSGIVVKADHVRLIGRESLRLVTNTDKKNSQGGDIHSWNGIWLMANNDEDGLQPIPKGDNLEDALDKMNENIRKLIGILHGYIKRQQDFNRNIATHEHIAPFFGITTAPQGPIQNAFLDNAIKEMMHTERSILSHLTNLAGWKNNFLLPHGRNTTKANPSYINSRFNKTN